MNNSFIEELAELVRCFILKGDLYGIKYHLDQQPLKKRKSILNFKINGSTALIKACELQRHQVIRYLVEESACDVSLPSENGVTPTQVSCNVGDVVLLQYLHKKGGNIYVTEACTHKTLLITSITKPDICKYLLSRGISVQACDSVGRTALDYAITEYNIKTSTLQTVELLLHYGASVNAANNLNNTHIFEACNAGNVDILELLIHYGADVNFVDTERRTYLILFIKTFYTCRFLIRGGVCINAKDINNRTALHHALLNDAEYEIVKLLVNCGADTDENDDDCLSPSAYAIDKANVNVLHLLLSSGSSVNAVDKNHSTLLHRVVETNSSECVKLLLEHGADINLCNNKGRNPVLTAAVLNYKKFVDYAYECNVETYSKIEVYELLASNQFELFHYAEGYDCLQSALQLRRQCRLPKKSKTVLNSLFPNHFEPETLEELTDIENDNSEMLIQVILTRGRILGSLDKSLISPIECYIESYLNLQAEPPIRKHLCAIALNSFGHKSSKSLTTKRTLIKSLWETGYQSTPFTLEVLEDFSQHIRELVKESDTKSLSIIYKDCVSLAYLLLMENEDKSNVSIRSKIEDIIVLCPTETGIRPRLIHFLLSSISDDFLPFIPGVVLVFIHLLLRQGIEMNSIQEGRMPLHSYLRCCFDDGDFSENDKETIERTIHLLVSNGNHLCTADSDGVTIFEMLEERLYPFCRVRDRTLQCLAADVITNHQIRYADVVPHLIPFIEFHQVIARSRTNSLSSYYDSSDSLSLSD